MTSKKYSLGFTTLQREKSEDDVHYIDLDNVEVWIKNLPLGNAGQTAKLLHSNIENKNKIELDYEDRMDYLELIRDPLFHINSIMESYFVGVNFPLTLKQQKIASASRDFHYLMMMGYIIAIEELFDQSTAPIEDKNLGLLIHRAITYLSRVLLISYQVYVPISKTIWEKINKLYLFAEENKIDQIPILDNQHQYIHETTVAGEYARIISLTLAEPYHLRNGEVSNIYINLERWLDSITPKAVNKDMKIDADFTINLKRDEAPRFGKLKPEKLSSGDYRLICTNELIKEVDSELERSELLTSNTLISANLGDAGLSHGLLRRLKRSWSAARNEKAASKNVSQKVDLVIGISSIYDMLIQLSRKRQEDKDAKLSMQRNFNMHFDEMNDCNVDDIEYIKLDAPTVGGAIEQNDSEKTDNSDEIILKDKLNLGEWDLITEDVNEFCLKCKKDCVQQIQVGEIVGLHQINRKNDEVSIAIISWLKTHGKSGVTFGAKPISPSAIPIIIRILANDSKTDPGQRAILLPLSNIIGLQSSIITYPAPFRSGSLAAITINKNSIPIRLTEKLENSGLYNRFYYERMTDKKAVKKKVKKKIKKPKNNDEVWNSF